MPLGLPSTLCVLAVRDTEAGPAAGGQRPSLPRGDESLDNTNESWHFGTRSGRLHASRKVITDISSPDHLPSTAHTRRAEDQTALAVASDRCTGLGFSPRCPLIRETAAGSCICDLDGLCLHVC